MNLSNLAADLDAYLREQEGKEFDWATFNCCHFAQGWAQRQEGIEADLVPKAGSKTAVFRAIKEHGGMEEGISDALRREPKPVAYARPGDVVLLKRHGASMLGICVGRTAACLGEGKMGIIHVPIEDGHVAWTIGEKE